jgi:hypothetical protein
MVLARHRTAQRWDELPQETRAQFSTLRAELLEYAAALAARLRLRTRLIPFASHPNPSGRNPLYYWCCVFPEKVKNKSYGFQLFLIVHPTHVEIGFGIGAGTGGQKADQGNLQRRLQEAKQRLLEEMSASPQFSKQPLEKAFDRGAGGFETPMRLDSPQQTSGFFTPLQRRVTGLSFPPSGLVNR